jgi:subfamily B ATP-binding cassette protein MsbA
LLIILVAVLWSIHPLLTLVSMALMPLYVVSIKTVGVRVRLVAKEAQQRLELLSGNLQERIAGVSVVKGFTREQQETRAFAVQANKLLNKIVHSTRFTAMNEVLVGVVVHGSPVLVAWYGVHLIFAGRLTVGELTQFLLYLAMFYFPLQRLSELSVVLANALAAIERIFEYFDTQPAVMERTHAATLKRCEGRIQFNRVQFSYDPGRPVLHDICLHIAPGQTVAIVGPSGSGKSTLANLVPRFYDPDSGSVLLDGGDLRDIALPSLRRHIGIVNQETILFSGTVEENLLLANPQAGTAEVWRALEAANAREFVEDLPEGLWTEIGERGAVLSGGQKQRLAIARAFLKDPRILILDEATSALDSRAEHLIQEALARLLRQRTSIIIAHRLSTIINADSIVVMDGGRILETGDHGSLLQKGGLYAQLYAEQFRHLESVPSPRLVPAVRPGPAALS